MAHPPDIDSNLTFTDWLKTVNATGKGMKLDCKSMGAAVAALGHMKTVNATATLHAPFWVNADVISGPNSDADEPIDPNQFIRLVQKMLPTSTLSLGWKLSWSPEASEQEYSWYHITEMLKHTININETSVSYPVGAVFTVKSWQKLVWLLGFNANHTLTIWSIEVPKGIIHKLRDFYF